MPADHVSISGLKSLIPSCWITKRIALLAVRPIPLDFCCGFTASPIICDVLLIVCDLNLHHFHDCSVVAHLNKREGLSPKVAFLLPRQAASCVV